MTVLKRCPYKDEVDIGSLAIAMHGDAPELHELGEQIDKLCEVPISHENFTRAVLALVPSATEVRTTWHTGPWTVEVVEP